MAISATTAAIIVAAAAVAGAGATAASAAAARGQAKAQSKVMKQQAEQERRRALEKERDFRRRQRRLQASVRAAGGARGIEMGTGSPLLAERDFSTETEVMADRIKRGGDLSATRLEQQASLIKQAGQAEFATGLVGAGGSLLSGAGRSAQVLRRFQDTNQPAG